MKIKTLLFFALAMLSAMGLFFLTNPSYEKSLEAKYHYEIGNYEDAYKLANEAFALDLYNRMASTIMAQSKTAMRYTKYISQSKEYMQQIQAIISKPTVTTADRAKIKMICEVMIQSYEKLAPSVVTHPTLTQEAQKYYEEFNTILDTVSK